MIWAGSGDVKCLLKSCFQVTADDEGNVIIQF